MHKTFHLGLFLLFSPWPLAGALTAAESTEFNGSTPLEWAVRMADAEIQRGGPELTYGGRGRHRWDYTTGLFSLALLDLGVASGNERFTEFATNYIGSLIDEDGTIRTYNKDDYNLDMITPGKVVLRLFEQTGAERFRPAMETLREQLREQPRTASGGFWHKQRYPEQMWLDGLYMAAPFYAGYARRFDEPEALDDVVHQLLLVGEKTYDPASGLFYHAWDEARAQSWANKETGTSPNFWGRAMGWYAMALVDTLDYLPAVHRDSEAVVAMLRRLADGVARHQDPATGLWWQVLNLPGREGNYLEATASNMFVYALAKAVNRGYLPRDQFLPVIRRGYEGIIRDFVSTDSSGAVNLNQCCSVAGLGYTSAAYGPRDGTFEYYISEEIVSNDLKGVGPFIWAGLEMQTLLENQTEPQSLRVSGWDALPALLARIQAPEFPARDFDITNFGAVPGGVEDCTAAIGQAIEACHAADGGRVVVPAGVWLTGAIHLKSNVNLHVVEGATLKFSTDPAKYLPVVHTRWEGVEGMNYSPLIYAYDQENIAITGGGVLDGQASEENWWSWNGRARPTPQTVGRNRLFAMGENDVPVAERVIGEGGFLRPNFVQPYRCRNVLIEGVTVRNSPMWHLHPVLCTNVTVRGVTVIGHGPNNDGCNPESSRDVLIENCSFDTGDDCIAIKSGRNNDGRRVATASENIIVRNCIMKDGHGGVVLGSEISGGVRNVFVEDCVMDSPNLERGLRFKNNARRGGVLENVFMRNVTIGRVLEAVLTIDLLYEEGPHGPHQAIVRNVRLDHVTSTGSPRVMWIAGYPGAIIDNVRFTDCEFRGIEATDVLHDAGSVEFRNVVIEPAVKGRSLNSPTAQTAGGGVEGR